jgi:hypothetical protein
VEEHKSFLKASWRFEIDARKAVLWVDLIPIQCPECFEKGEWPAAFPKPKCARCLMYWDRTTVMHRVREPVPERPKRRSTSDELADLRTQVARLADALEGADGQKHGTVGQLPNGEVEAPEEQGREQDDVGGDPVAHARRR